MRGFVLASAVMLAATAASAATYVPVVPASGSTNMKIQGINDRNEIAGGYYTADGIEHGFAGTADGTYQTFDLGVRFTEPHHINNMDMMVGNTDDGQQDGIDFAFERSARTGKTFYIKDGHVVIEDGQAYGINEQGVVVGEGLNPDGYYALKGRYTSDLTISQSALVEPRGINASNVVAGTYLDPTIGYPSHGFILQGGVSTQIDYPDARAVGTELNDINDSGMAVGEWLDAHHRPHPFEYNTATATFKALRPPGSGYAQAWAINGHGLIAIYAKDAGASFIYCPKTTGCPSGEAARGR